VRFNEAKDLVMHRRKSLPFHPNGMCFEAFDEQGVSLLHLTYYSVGGGFVLDEAAAEGENPVVSDSTELPYPFTTGAELLQLSEQHNLSIAQMMMANECVWRSEAEVRERVLSIWQVMQSCVARGCKETGTLPGGMNAAGGRVVTAPTNGAAGIIPAVLHYYMRFIPGANEDGVVDFLLTAAAIGILYKENASISGAEVGCQGEVGSACSMAAGALAAVCGGTTEQVENAAEIGMGGLVQVPCIERNAMASVKAINASRIALRGDGQHFVSLDKVIKTMRDTGADMKTKYKETARGGLAINVIEVPVSLPDC